MCRQSAKRVGGKDMLQLVDFARFLVGEVKPLRREAR